MKRSLKNAIMVIMICVSIVGAGFTYNAATTAETNNTQQVEMQAPPSQQDSQQNSDSSSSDGNSFGSSQNQQPPEMPSGDSSQQPPAKPDENSSDSSSSDGNSSDSSQNKQPPEMPSGNSSKQPPDMQGNDTMNCSIDSKYTALFALEALVVSAILVYLIMSGFNKKSFKETMNSTKRALIYVLAVAVITGGLTFSAVNASCIGASDSTSQSQQMPGSQSSQQVDAAGATTVDGKEQTLTDSYISTTADESAILVTNGGSATVNGATINKKSGDSTNTENSEFNGVNSGVLVQKDSTAIISDSEINTSAGGANAVFATGEGAKIYLKNTTITTTGERSSRGLDATYGGYIEADNVRITTQGGSCATLATDRGEGTVIAKNSTLETNGSGSPVIYSTGDISIENTKGTANGSQMVVIEGKNSATVTKSTLTASASGNRGDTDVAGIMIYQSMSGDAGEGTGTFTATDSTLSVQSSSKYYKTAPMFFITNTDAVINLTNTKLTYGSGILISAKGTDEWGTSGSNAGNVTLNAKNQSLKGNIEADKISSVTLNLTDSQYEGAINADNSAKSVTLKLDKSSKIKLTGNSYVTSLENADSSNSNIDFNGYTLYVNGKAVK